MFEGSHTALVTPFNGDRVDEDAYARLIEHQIAGGTAGIVPCGTTGESATLSHEEHERVVELAVRAARGRVKVIAGTGSNSTAEAMRLSKAAERAGCDGVLLVSPYYNKPTQEGLYRHFCAVASAVKIPVMLYNIQGRTAVNIEPATMARIVKDAPNVIAVKEASGSLDQVSAIRAACPAIEILSGDDSLTLPMLAVGGCGVVSVAANIVPRPVAGLVQCFLAGDIAGARDAHYRLLPLIKALFLETNPIPVKTAMGMLKMCDPAMRLPLCVMGTDARARLELALRDFGLLS